MNPTDTFYAFAEHMIDYAGMFPPARLPLQAAIRHHALYLRGSERWLMGRFVMPASRLPELDERLMRSFSAETPLSLCLISSDLAGDVSIIRPFQQYYGPRTIVDMIETRLPDAGDVEAIIERQHRLLQNGSLSVRVFYELPFNAAWDAHIAPTIQTIAAFNRSAGSAHGFKLRCGGLQPADFPTPEQVAQAIIVGRDAGVAIKCTAGLHHPVRHMNSGVRTMMHGFINVFAGGILAHVHHLTMAELAEIIAEEDGTAFQFSADRLRWRELEVTIGQIMAVRHNALLSFGSCSVDEPHAGLTALGLLGEMSNPKREAIL
jgi:hypothetical protein